MATALAPTAFTDRLYAWRDRLLADRRFQRWALAFPLTRPVARRRTRELFDLVAGFVYAQVLAACVELDLFEQLADGPRTTAELAAHADMTPSAMARLLQAAASLRLVRRCGTDRYGLGELGAALRADPAIAAMVAHHRLFYADLQNPVGLLRGEGRPHALERFWSYVGAEATGTVTPGEAEAYSALMAASQSFIADEVLDSYAVGRHQTLLDVGGGNGAFLRAAGKRHPKLTLHLFDLPPVVAEAGHLFDGVGLGPRTIITPGSFRDDPLPTGADLISLIRVAYDHDDDVVLALFRKVRACLPSDGRLLVAEPMTETPGAEAAGAAYFGFYTLAMGTGRPRSPTEHRALLQEAGFSRVRLLPGRNPLLTRALVAQI